MSTPREENMSAGNNFGARPRFVEAMEDSYNPMDEYTPHLERASSSLNATCSASKRS